MTVSKKSSVERNPPVYEGSYGDCPGHKRSKSQCKRAELRVVCGNQSQLMKTPDLDSHGTFEEFCGASGNHMEKGMYRGPGQEKENFSSDFMWDIANERGCSDEFDGSAQRIPVRKSDIIVRKETKRRSISSTPLLPTTTRPAGQTQHESDQRASLASLGLRLL